MGGIHEIMRRQSPGMVGVSHLPARRRGLGRHAGHLHKAPLNIWHGNIVPEAQFYPEGVPPGLQDLASIPVVTSHL